MALRTPPPEGSMSAVQQLYRSVGLPQEGRNVMWSEPHVELPVERYKDFGAAVRDAIASRVPPDLP